MKLRYAKNSDFGFLIEGLEQNRVLENRAREQIRAKPSDREQFKEAISKKNIRIIEEDGKPVAFLYFRTDFKVMYFSGKIFWIDLIYVKESHRRKGLGKLLYNDAIGIARKRGYRRVTIDIFESNTASKKFHKRLGFKPVYAIYHRKI